jgi:hypothetical protein
MGGDVPARLVMLEVVAVDGGFDAAGIGLKDLRRRP